MIFIEDIGTLHETQFIIIIIIIYFNLQSKQSFGNVETCLFLPSLNWCEDRFRPK